MVSKIFAVRHYRKRWYSGWLSIINHVTIRSDEVVDKLCHTLASPLSPESCAHMIFETLMPKDGGDFVQSLCWWPSHLVKYFMSCVYVKDDKDVVSKRHSNSIDKPIQQLVCIVLLQASSRKSASAIFRRICTTGTFLGGSIRPALPYDIMLR